MDNKMLLKNLIEESGLSIDEADCLLQEIISDEKALKKQEKNKKILELTEAKKALVGKCYKKYFYSDGSYEYYKIISHIGEVPQLVSVLTFNEKPFINEWDCTKIGSVIVEADWELETMCREYVPYSQLNAENGYEEITPEEFREAAEEHLHKLLAMEMFIARRPDVL